MKLLYCGFNGFGQCPAVKTSTLSQLTEYPVTGVKEVSLAWSCMAVLTGEEMGVVVDLYIHPPPPHLSSWHSAN